MNNWTGGNNQITRRLEAMERARKTWNDSEWVLRMLRSRSATEAKMPDDETLLDWHQRITSEHFMQRP